MGLVFAHGWAMGPDVWEDLIANLPADFTVECLDLGYFDTPPITSFKGDIAVGHSLGLLWLLSQNRPWKAAISLNGFTQFAKSSECPHGVSPRILDKMLTLMETDPMRCVQDFYKRYDISGKVPEILHSQRLIEGLRLLKEGHVSRPSIPLLALVSGSDPLVSRELSEFCFGRIITSQVCGHVLPKSDPLWCVDQMVRFLRGLNELHSQS